MRIRNNKTALVDSKSLLCKASKLFTELWGFGPVNRASSASVQAETGPRLTTVEADHAAEVRVGGFLLDTERVFIAHSSQVVVDHLKRTLRGVQPPANRRRWKSETK